MESIYGLAVTFFVLYFAANVTGQSCDIITILANVKKCLTTQIDDFYNFQDGVVEFCKDPECNLECFQKAVGTDCLTSNILYLPLMNKVSARAVCANKDTIGAILGPCGIDSFTGTISSSLTALSGTVSLSDLCTAYQTSSNSVQSNYAALEQNSCTAANAELTRDIFLYAFATDTCPSISKPTTADWGTKYSDDVACSASGFSAHVTGLAILVILVNTVSRL